MDSILNSIKKLLGIEKEYEVFDADIIMHINSVFLILCQMGVGPDKPFVIHDNSATWSDFWGDKESNEAVITYVYMKVKSIFDPPSSGTANNAMDALIKEMEWRLNVNSSIGE